ncbi:type II secretion system F family protein [Glutamicibacter sp.]|uniref:type II secretion system F family protein n=1 Tax=Glutamicibacter sp. TaxID=1931995 RepID=UPI0028BE5C55|nr:type II secretion system F family protein [Glutamicibacter sp.]
MNSYLPWAVLCGSGLGLGLWIVILRLPAWRPMSFADRVASHIRVGVRSSRMLEDSWQKDSGKSAVWQLARPLLEQLKRLTTVHSPTSATVKRRLRAAGLQLSLVDYRSQELLCAFVGVVSGAALMIALSLRQPLSFVFALIVVIGCGLLGYFLRGWWLGEQVRKRARRILTQFPTVAEVLALTVGAGESTTGAIERISRICHGEIGDELTQTLNDIHAGTSMVVALSNMSDRIQIGAMTRFVDAITVATERGTPLGQVLRDQAQDVRDASKRELMEIAGKREISMLVPIVFGVLPLTIVFAIFPGLALLEMSY